MNIKTLKWDPKLCDFFGVAEECLPNIKSSAEVYGHISYQNCPLPDTIPIAGCLGDQQAALVITNFALTKRPSLYYVCKDTGVVQKIQTSFTCSK